MTEQVTSTEFELVVRGQAELRSDFKEMAKEHREDMKSITAAHVDLSQKFSVFLERDEARKEDVSEIKAVIHDPENGINKRLQDVEQKQAVSQEGNKVRWQVLAAGVAGFISVSAIVITIVLWAFDKYLGG